MGYSTPTQSPSGSNSGIVLSLEPYTGPFDRARAWHLLRRASFGVTADRVEEAVALGLAGSLDQLLRNDDFVGVPINVEASGDPNVPIGSTWIEAPYVQGFNVNTYRQRSLVAWQLRSYREGGFSAQARLSLFWHNHFSVSRDNADARLFYTYLATLRRFALGNVRELLTTIATDGAMLRFLNGNENIVGSPNENFARELLELYTLGKGPHAEAGDYTTYTEQDVRAVARALTGWTVRNINSTVVGAQPGAVFIAGRHDTSVKQLSPRLGSADIPASGQDEYLRVLDIVFAQPSMGDYLVRKLYRWFVHYDITAEVERDIIQPLAAELRANDFELAPVLRLLLGSAHFFDMQRRSAHIESPVEFALKALAALQTPLPTNPRGEQQAMLVLVNLLSEQQQILSQPPTVAGWKAYYQAPLYDRTWISATTLAARTDLAKGLTTAGLMIAQNNTLAADLLGLVEGFDNPDDPSDLVRELTERLLPEPLTEVQITSLKSVLLPGLPDFEWTVEYGQHRANPQDTALAAGLEAKLRILAETILTTAEAHLC